MWPEEFAEWLWCILYMLRPLQYIKTPAPWCLTELEILSSTQVFNYTTNKSLIWCNGIVAFRDECPATRNQDLAAATGFIWLVWLIQGQTEWSAWKPGVLNTMINLDIKHESEIIKTEGQQKREGMAESRK